MAIKFYKTKDPYGFLNNFKRARMFLWGKWWNNVETPYQAAKCITDEDREKIYKAATPREARDLGQTVQLRYDWDYAKDRIMYECCMAKFLQHPDLRKQLMETGDEELIEDSEDSYWGCGTDGKGRNQLGKTLMQIRDTLKGE